MEPAKTRIDQGCRPPRTALAALLIVLAGSTGAQMVSAQLLGGQQTVIEDPRGVDADAPHPPDMVFPTRDAAEAAALSEAMHRDYEPIDLTGFEDAIRHYRYIRTDLDYPRYRPEQTVRIAENLLLYQTADGGWPKNIDWLRVVTPDEARRIAADEMDSHGATIDNHNVWTQAVYLARVYNVAGLDRHRGGAERAIDFLLNRQHPTGGWRGADVDAITFNDDVMAGALTALDKVARGDEPFGWIDDGRRARARTAVDKGIDCILKCQIRMDGKLTAWCQQHAYDDFRPIGARTYELASLCAKETVTILEFLMKLERPSPGIVASIEGAMAWLESAKIDGLRLESRPIPPWRYAGRLIDEDRVAVADLDAPPIWARYYDLEKGEPLFVRRSGEIVADYNDIDQERRFGYGWYGYWPEESNLKAKYAAWRERRAPPNPAVEN
jgi:PelA/Pel-15E family pectate lyase